MTGRRQLHPDEWNFSKSASFAQGVEVNDTVYVAGQVGLDDAGDLVGADGDMRAQARQTFKNIETVLAEGGASLDDVVKITCYITDVTKYADYSAVRGEVFEGNLPTSATVVVTALVQPKAIVEVDAVAVKSK